MSIHVPSLSFAVLGSIIDTPLMGHVQAFKHYNYLIILNNIHYNQTTLIVCND